MDFQWPVFQLSYFSSVIGSNQKSNEPDAIIGIAQPFSVLYRATWVKLLFIYSLLFANGYCAKLMHNACVHD